MNTGAQAAPLHLYYCT